MTKKIILLPLILLAGLGAFSQVSRLVKGMKISRSANIKKGVYSINADTSLQQPVISIHGNNIVVDFNTAALKGSVGRKRPDEFFGLAVFIHDSKKVTIRNLSVQGYKVALLAKNVEELVLENCDFSYNYRQHLNSTQEKEDLSDWLSYHHNENDEWLRYGTAMYLRGCNNAVIKNCKVTGGQNALMMMECNNALVYNNDFSFNSGVGIAMYRSSGNQVLYNRLIFNVRGYSDGVYYRGQDSAGILVYEQSNNNLFYKNNVTHSGDGFFLWAGQTTMDNGQGGCNDNLLYANDFSYAPTNGVELTFSRNKIIDNRIFECDNGLWGGYSYASVISGNQFRNNNTAIAIEHGQQNEIAYNLFYKNKMAIHLWARASQPADWGYARYRDTRSRNYIVTNNNFTENGIAYVITRTDSLHIFNNIHRGNTELFRTDSTVTNLDTLFNEMLTEQLFDDSSIHIPVIDNPADPFKNTSQWAGRKNIFVTEWGPYDFRSPIIWNTNPTDTGNVLQFVIKGPAGKWKIKSFRGVDSFSSISGSIPAVISAKKMNSSRTDIRIVLEFTGEKVVTPFGQTIPAGKPYQFIFQKFFQPVDWQVKWYELDTSVYNPVKTGKLFPDNFVPVPFKTQNVKQLDYAWWGGMNAGKQYTQFITVAEGTVAVPDGNYAISVTWDDAVRVYVDGKLVLDEWNPSLYNFDESPHRQVALHLNGNHTFRVEHLELGGFATLGLKLKKVQEQK